MVLLESVPEVIAGVAVEFVMFGIFVGVIYRFLSGKFLIPKREIVLPNQNGVIVQGDRIVRVAKPGSCWVRPKQRIILCDMRPRSLQIAGVDVICRDTGIVRLSLSGDYSIADAATYYTSSTNANDAIYVALRRCLFTAARQQQSATLVSAPAAFAAIFCEAAESEVSKLGLTISKLDIWESLHVGWFRQPESATTGPEDIPGALIH